MKRVGPLVDAAFEALTEDLKALADGELFRRLSQAIRAVPGIGEAGAHERERAWEDVFRYHDELARRYPPRSRPDSRKPSAEPSTESPPAAPATP